MLRSQREDFGPFFKQTRKGKGYSIKNLARELMVDYSYLSKIENGHTLPSEEFIKKIAKLFGHDEEEIMLRAGKIPEDIIRILRENPKEAIDFLRKKFRE